MAIFSVLIIAFVFLSIPALIIAVICLAIWGHRWKKEAQKLQMQHDSPSTKKIPR